MKAWHFLREDRRLRFPPHQLVEAGKVYTVEPPVEMCKWGLHGSKRLIDALKYAPGSIICRVELSGEMLHQQDKSVATERRVLWMLDAFTILHEFACRCAEDGLKLTEKADPRFWNAIHTKRRWLKGEVSDKELAEAAQAASWAVRVAVGAWDAGFAAARAAARDGAVFACLAVRGAGDAAWTAAEKRQNRRLTAMVCAEYRKQLEVPYGAD